MFRLTPCCLADAGGTWTKEGNKQKALLTREWYAKHNLPLPSSGEGTSTSCGKFNLELGALAWHGT